MTRLLCFTLLWLLPAGEALAGARYVALPLVAPGMAEGVRAEVQRAYIGALPTDGGLVVAEHARCGPPFDKACMQQTARRWQASVVFAAWVERADDTCAVSFVAVSGEGALLHNATKVVDCAGDGAALGGLLAEMATPPPGKKAENRSAEKRRAEIAEQAASKGVLAIIGTRGDSGDAGSVADVFAEEEATEGGSLDDALGAVGGVGTGAGSGGLGIRGGGAGGGGGGSAKVGLGGLGRAGGAPAPKVKEEAKKAKKKKKKRKRAKRDAAPSPALEGAAPAASVPAPPPPPPAPPAERDAEVQVARFPTVESPSRVPPGKKFAVQVSLTEDEITPEVVVRSGKTDASGRLVMALPSKPQGWELDVILSAPGFEVVGGGNTGVIRLPESGDSTPAMFQLVAEDVAAPNERKLYATFWHDGAYLAKVVRPILVAPKDAVVAKVKSQAPPRSSGAPTVTPTGRIVAPDMTVWLTRVTDPSRPELVTTVLQINSPYLQPQTHTISHAPVSAAWLRSKYSRLAPKAARGVNLGGAGGAAAPKSSAQTRIDRMVGFGRVVWDKLAPQAFRDAFWALRDKRGDRFQSLQIFTNDPALPWELMRPARTGRDGRTEELDFLGLELDVGRWHVVTRSRGQLDRPPQRTALAGVRAIAPEYPAAQALPGQGDELKAVSALRGFQRVPGVVPEMRKLVREGVGGIVHFAGHGDVLPAPDGSATYAMRLQDDLLDLDVFRGMAGGPGVGGSKAHALYFFNACDIGQADSTAGFVDGWAPAVLEAGAAGYVGGLWPLGDQGASAFAQAFYGHVQAGLDRDGEVRVATALRQARKAFYDTADPTHLAYVYYGDPNLTFTRAGD